MPSRDLLATLLLTQPSTLLAFFVLWQGHVAGSCSLGVHKDPQVLFYKAAFQLVSPSMYGEEWHGVIPPWVQDFALPFVELQEVPVCPSLQPAQVPLVGSTNLWHNSHSSQLCVTSKHPQRLWVPPVRSHGLTRV